MDYNKIKKLCELYGIENWSIENGLVDVDADVFMYDRELTEIPLPFGKVSGYFDCSFNNLKSLKGCPYHVGNFFNCSNNLLTSLDYIPKHIGTTSYINRNMIYDVLFMSDIFDIEKNPVYNVYKYITNIDEDEFMTLKVSIDYFNDCKILIGKDIYIDRFKDFLEEYGLNSNINIEELIETGYSIK